MAIKSWDFGDIIARSGETMGLERNNGYKILGFKGYYSQIRQNKGAGAGIRLINPGISGLL